MAYTLKLTDGRILLNLPDQKTDQLTTSITLIGKNVGSYGTSYNENFIYLLENFASPSQPRSPLIGQLWYNTQVGRMFVYNQTNQFKPVGGPVVSPIVPTLPVAGDLWLDTVNKQLNVYDGTNYVTAGPIYSNVQGKAGWVVEEILDNTNITRTVTSLYNNGVLLAILSDIAFVPSVPYKGIAAVSIGLTFNNSIAGIKVVATATNSTAIANVDATKYLRNDTNDITSGQFSVLNDAGLTVGALQNLQFYVDNLGIVDASNTASAVIHSIGLDKHLDLVVNGSAEGTQVALTVNPVGKKMGIWNTNPQANLDVKGDVKISGNLTVIGNNTNVTVKNLEVENLTIELAYPIGSFPDAGLDGAGIILHGTTDHTILYKPEVPGWEMSEHLNLVTGKGYFIGGSRVIDGYNTYVTGAPNLTSIGALTSATIGNIVITTSSIYTLDGKDLVLNKPGIGNIDAGGKKIIGLAPNTANDSTTTAVTKYYVDNIQALKSSNTFVFSLDVTGISDVNLFVISYLNKMLPIGLPSDFHYVPDQSRCRVNTMSYAIAPTTVTGVDTGRTFVPVDQNGVKNAVNVLTDVTVQVTTPILTPSVSQVVIEYTVIGGQWVYSTTIG